jgi:hypothetical protein
MSRLPALRLLVFDVDSVLDASRPGSTCADAMAVIRWFQIQPGIQVCFTTRRPEAQRTATLVDLDALGRRHRVRFPEALVQMDGGHGAGLRAFAAAGYTPVAVFDHDLRSLVGEADLPPQVELVWHGVNDAPNLRQFLASPVRWAECDVRRGVDGRLVLRHDPEALGNGDRNGDGSRPSRATDAQLDAAELLLRANRAGKSVKFDVKEPGVIDDLMRVASSVRIADDRLWFNGRVDVLGERSVHRIHAAHGRAVVQCPVDDLVPLIAAAPSEARERLDRLAAWGVSRFSLRWRPSDDTGGAAGDHPSIGELLDRFDDWGFDVNLYAVAGLEQFLRAVVLLPRSVTADFNFPEWHYFGRGSGQGGRYHRYRLDPTAPATPTVDVA